MTTNPREPALYRGEDRALATAALARWQPDLGEHDARPALRVARRLAAAAGRSLLITDRRARVPADQCAVGIGRPIDNVGFAGAAVTREETGHVWRALVRNHAATGQRRAWYVDTAAGRSAEETIELAPGALLEISARLPEGVAEATVVLSPDAFAADDRLPLVRPRPKPLLVAVAGANEPADFFRKLAAGIEGVTVLAAGASAAVKIMELDGEALAREPRGGIFWPPAAGDASTAVGGRRRPAARPCRRGRRATRGGGRARGPARGRSRDR
jgi:hypothetical protein